MTGCESKLPCYLNSLRFCISQPERMALKQRRPRKRKYWSYALTERYAARYRDIRAVQDSTVFKKICVSAVSLLRTPIKKTSKDTKRSQFSPRSRRNHRLWMCWGGEKPHAIDSAIIMRVRQRYSCCIVDSIAKYAKRWNAQTILKPKNGWSTFSLFCSSSQFMYSGANDCFLPKTFTIFRFSIIFCPKYATCTWQL